MTPEQIIRNQLTNYLRQVLPKGRYLLQPIETNNVGVPDFYLAYNGKSLWIETKALTYGLDKFQYNWQATAIHCGISTVLLTSIPAHHKAQPIQHSPTPTQHPPSTLYSVPYNKDMLKYSTLGAYINANNPVLTGLSEILELEFS